MEDCAYLEKSIREYLGELSAREIIPGGGSAAALAAALGAGLNMMVINYSGGHDSDAAMSKEMVVLRERQKASLEKLKRAVDEDCAAFSGLMGAIRKGEGTEDKYIRAASVPMDICRDCCESMEVTSVLLDNSNRNLLSDVGCAAHLLKAAFSAASLNVRVNLKYIKAGDFVRVTEETLVEMDKKILNLEKEINARVSGALKEKRREKDG